MWKAPRARWVGAEEAVGARFASLVHSDRGIRGNLVPDTYIAALALAHGAAVATADRGFGRFPGLRVIDPTRPTE